MSNNGRVSPTGADSTAPTTHIGPLTWVVGVLVVVCFAPYLQWMWRIWMKSEYYSHGPLIPLLSAYLVYTRRRQFAAAPVGRYHLWGVPIILGCLAVHGLATYWDVNFPQGFDLIGVLGGLVLLLWGWERAKILAFPILFLCFMVPVDRLLVTKFSNPLQLGSARVAAAVPAALGVPVKIYGTTIVIPDYTFEVAQACSGLKSVIAMSALAALFAYLVTAPMYKRLLLFRGAGGAAGQRRAHQPHAVAGQVLRAGGRGGLLPQRFRSCGFPLRTGGTVSGGEGITMRQHARRHLLAVALMLLGVAVTYGARALRPSTVHYHPDFSAIPMKLAGYTGSENPKDQALAEYLEAEEMRGIHYQRGADVADVSLIYGPSWRTVHTPKACFPSAGWAVVWEKYVEIPCDPAQLPHPGPVVGELMRVEREGQALLVLFVFAHKGGSEADYARHSLAVMSGPRGAGGLSIMMTSPVDQRGERHAQQVLLEVMAALYPHAVSFWYQEPSTTSASSS